eukprot:TRINITY_DN11470_c0_g1_i1.p1 TRINITY_DN11470_c0_g1~~TRINITY_DN11470_c0_g1_i1.p1  ORF type:complete len:381 (-),score=74.68 TRINITY_DN11470_c0_g1_i1:78-1220(-)
MIKFLLDQGANPNLQGGTHFALKTLDALAYFSGTKQVSKDVVNLLCSRGAELNLHNAIVFDYLDFVESLLRNENANPNSLSLRGDRPLHLAVEHKRYLILTLLLCHGANPLLPNANEKTSLQFACEKGDVRMVELMLMHIELTKIKPHISELIQVVLSQGNSELMLLLQLHCTSLDVLPAILVENYEVVEAYILSFGVDKKVDNTTLICYASKFGSFEMVRRILRHRPSMEISWNYQTPLEIATFYNRPIDIVLLLVEHLPRPNPPHSLSGPHWNESLSGALWNAVRAGSVDVTRLLLEKEANPNTTFRSCPVLIQACNRGNMEIVKLLLLYKANLDLRDSHSRTALAWAIFNNKEEIVKILLMGYGTMSKKMQASLNIT